MKYKQHLSEFELALPLPTTITVQLSILFVSAVEGFVSCFYCNSLIQTLGLFLPMVETLGFF